MAVHGGRDLLQVVGGGRMGGEQNAGEKERSEAEMESSHRQGGFWKG
jgi:hypothetical protein